MPLPLPSLDTRRWADLTDEGRAAIPRYSPRWTDHNLHDPGITLLELFAWLTEQDVYWVNRIPESHRRKFLELVGFAPTAPLPARLVLGFSLVAAAPMPALPAGVVLATSTAANPVVRFRTRAPVTIVPASIRSVQSFDGAAFGDLTSAWAHGLPLQPWGPNPLPGADGASGPALYLGWDEALPVGVPVGLWLEVQGPGADEAARERVLDEGRRRAIPCPPAAPLPPCTPPPPKADAWCPPEPPAPGGVPSSGPSELPPHHTVRTAWEYHDAQGWHVLDPGQGQIRDGTRSLTLEGPVVLAVPTAMDLVAVGADATPRFHVRCRMTAGPPDAAPVLLGVVPNAVVAEQASPATSTLPVAPGVVPPAGSEPAAGTWARLDLMVDPNGTISSLATNDQLDVPETLVLAYEPATAQDPGSLETTLVWLGSGTGAPGQQLVLPGAPVVWGAAEIWSTGSAVQRWTPRRDLVASTPVDAHYALDASSGVVSFGDGARGRVVPEGDAVLASFDTTVAGAGNVPARSAWRLDGAHDALNAALLGQDPSAVAAAIATTTNSRPGSGGAQEEDLETTAGRAVAQLWAHERLVEHCPPESCPSLDQIDRRATLTLPAPERAATLLDFERLALDVPGCRVARARAWAGIDPAYPCMHAPGTVTVVVVPSLPAGRPHPTPGLLEAVRRYLDIRRVVCTRLVVVGPEYLEVAVNATLSLRPGANAGRVQSDVASALDAFLDPLRGGPAGLGWPFGRDVYRSEILQVAAQVDGVDHVSSLELVPGAGEAECGNVCLRPTSLVFPGSHVIRIETTGQPI